MSQTPSPARDRATVAQLSEFDDIIDARTPSEFALDHIPGACNLPVLSDDERARVGTLYKQVSPFAAKKLGAALVAANIARHLEEQPAGPAQELAAAGVLLARRQAQRRVHARAARDRLGCARAGGRLQVVPPGGDRASFPRWRGACAGGCCAASPVPARAACWPRWSASARRCWTSSGLPPTAGRSWATCRTRRSPPRRCSRACCGTACAASSRQRPVYVESESKKIGVLQVPQELLDAMWASPCVQLDVDRATRVRLLMDQYAHFLRRSRVAGPAARLPGAAARPRHDRPLEADGACRRLGAAGGRAAGAPLRPGLHPRHRFALSQPPAGAQGRHRDRTRAVLRAELHASCWKTAWSRWHEPAQLLPGPARRAPERRCAVAVEGGNQQHRPVRVQHGQRAAGRHASGNPALHPGRADVLRRSASWSGSWRCRASR